MELEKMRIPGGDGAIARGGTDFTGSSASTAAVPVTKPVGHAQSGRYDGPEHECDLVMKGGITSGVVYPLAMCRLAEQYRFRSIGGASAGAIAAAAAAAAEHSRKTGARGDKVGFHGLERLPREIADPVEEGGPSRLQSLFQPSPAARTLFDVFLLAIGKQTVGRRVLRIIGLIARRHWLFPVMALALAAATLVWAARPDGALATAVVILTALCAPAVGLALAAVMAARRGLAGLASNAGGMCSGFWGDGHDRKGPPPLCQWLADLFDELAGKPVDGEPLTFGELASSDINLEMITTNLTHGRPYRLPLEGNAFFFRRSEMLRLFPERVVRAMTAAAERKIQRLSDKKEADRAPDEASLLALHEACQVQSPAEYFPFPDGPDLPVVVATRMSLSFPILLSAVPLHAVDTTSANGDGPPRQILERCWFSDGGICSNLPIHFFDAILPSRPTFALDLRLPRRDSDVELFTDGRSERVNVSMPDDGKHTDDGSSEQWSRIGMNGADLPAGDLLGAMVDAMQSWNDNMQSKVPGYRDRIVHIHHRGDEGGLNLNMPADVIARLANRGDAAGQLLVERFVVKKGFQAHLFTRYHSALAMLETLLGQAHKSYYATPDRQKLLADLLESPDSRFSKEQRELAARLNEEFAARGETFRAARTSLASDAPRPAPELRARPRGV
jgi:predicted acylesterase/phospholipase RssA